MAGIFFSMPKSEQEKYVQRLMDQGARNPTPLDYLKDALRFYNKYYENEKIRDYILENMVSGGIDFVIDSALNEFFKRKKKEAEILELNNKPGQ